MKQRVKDVVSYIGSGTTPKSGDSKYYDNAEIPWLNSGDLNNGLVISTTKCISKLALQDYSSLHLYPKGSVVVAMYGASIGKTGILDFQTTVNQACCVLIPNERVITSYYLHLSLQLSKDKFLLESFGGTQPNISQKVVANLLIDVPPLNEQEAIAAYLGRVCEKIGQQIELLERKADAYRRLWRSVIKRAVSAKSHNSMFFRLKNIFEMRNGYTPSKAVEEYWEGGSIPWFRMEDIRKNGRILVDSIQHITPQAVKAAGLFEAYSFILATTATIGEHAWLIADSLANQRFTNLKVRKSLINRISHKYLFYKFFEIDDYCKRSCRMTTFAAVDMNDLSNMPIYLPSIQEQQQIAAYLDDKCGKIDAIIEKIGTQVERLKELKRSLINEVVTGKRAIINV